MIVSSIHDARTYQASISGDRQTHLSVTAEYKEGRGESLPMVLAWEARTRGALQLHRDLTLCPPHLILRAH